MSTTPARHTHPRLEHALERHWQSASDLETALELPASSAESVVGSFVHAVHARAPRWVLVPLPPLTRNRAYRYLAALRRRGLQAVLRPSPGQTHRYSIWTRSVAEPDDAAQ